MAGALVIGLIFLFPALYLALHLLKPGPIFITHREAFTLGFLWYGAMPLIAIDLPYDLGTAVNIWRVIATLPGTALISQLMLWSMALWSAFIAGSWIASAGATSREPTGPPGKVSPEWGPLLVAGTCALLLFGMLWGVMNRDILFQGYSDNYGDTSRGPLQAAIVLAAYILVLSIRMKSDLGSLPLIAALITVIFLSILSLSVGTRQALILVVVMLFCCLSLMRGGLRKTWLFSISAIVIIGFSAIAVWRLGSSSIGYALLTPALESAYGFLSAATYLTFNEPASVSAPIPLLASFANLIPSSLWPDKVEFMDEALASYKIFSPLGGFHLFASLLINFGWIGSIILLFIFGWIMGRLQTHVLSGPTLLASYGLFSAVLTTDLWRNPFQISIVKTTFQFGIVFPLMLVLIVGIFIRIRSPLVKSTTCAIASDSE